MNLQKLFSRLKEIVLSKGSYFVLAVSVLLGMFVMYDGPIDYIEGVLRDAPLPFEPILFLWVPYVFFKLLSKKYSLIIYLLLSIAVLIFFYFMLTNSIGEIGLAFGYMMMLGTVGILIAIVLKVYKID